MLQATDDMLWQWQMPGMKMETSIAADLVYKNDCAVVSRIQCPSQHTYTRYFGNTSFEATDYIGTANQTQNSQENVQKTRKTNPNTKKMALVKTSKTNT